MPAGLSFLYEDVFNKEAICKGPQGLVRFQLYEVTGRDRLCWQPCPGVVQVSSVPVQVLHKRPAANVLSKKPAAKVLKGVHGQQPLQAVEDIGGACAWVFPPKKSF